MLHPHFEESPMHDTRNRMAKSLAAWRQQRILVANGHADYWAKRGTTLGVNEFLQYVDQAVSEQALLNHSSC